jgi:hypothetical protein
MRTWIVLAFSFVATGAQAVEQIGPEDAPNYIGQQAQVCGVVASAQFANRSRGQPTFLNLGTPFPQHIFTALIWGSNRPAFAYPPESLRGEEICVQGLISEFRGKPEIVVSRPSQITRASHQ